MVFAAYLEQSPDGRDRPRDARRKLRLVATGAKPSGQAVEVLVLNISTTGMLIESDDALTQGEALDIDLPHAGRATATVVGPGASTVARRRRSSPSDRAAVERSGLPLPRRRL